MGRGKKAGPFDFPTGVEDAKVRERALVLLKGNGVRLPTFAELAQPDRISRTLRAAVANIGADEPHPLNLQRVHWFNDLTRTRSVTTPVHIELPATLTGV